MNYFMEICSGIAITFALTAGAARYAILDSSSKIVLLIIASGLLFESAAMYAAEHSNLLLMNVYNAVHFLLVCIYFNHTIDVFIRNNTGMKIGIAGLLLGLAGTIDLSISHYLALAHGLFMTGMCLFAFYRLLARHEQLRLIHYHHFWFIVIFLFYWSIIYFIRSFCHYRGILPASGLAFAEHSIKLINLVTYAGIGFVFLLYKKKFTVHE